MQIWITFIEKQVTNIGAESVNQTYLSLFIKQIYIDAQFTHSDFEQCAQHLKLAI